MQSCSVNRNKPQIRQRKNRTRSIWREVRKTIKITECISIALRNHEFTYAEWFKYVDAQSGPDELALYSLARKYGIHTSVYNKS